MTASEDHDFTRLPGWNDAKRGLKLLFRALIVECIVLGGLVLLGIIAFVVDSVEFLPWASAFASVAMLLMVALGLNRFRQVPNATGAAGLATAAFGSALVTLGLFVVAVVVGFDSRDDTPVNMALSMRPFSFFAAAATAAFLLTLLLQLRSMRILARFIERFDVVEKGGTTRGILITLVIVFGLFQQAVSGRDIDAIGWPGFIALVYLGVLIWFLVYYMLTVHMLLGAFDEEVDVASAFD